MNKTIQIRVPKGKVAEWKEINGVTTLVFVDKSDNGPVTERIKTFEDAVKETGMKLPFDDNQLSCLPKDVVAYMKLRIIAAALNELEEETLDEFPKFTAKEVRWYPWLTFYSQEEIDKMKNKDDRCLCRFRVSSYSDSKCSIACNMSYNSWTYSHSDFTARLAVKSRELAFYFGKQFIDIWTDFLT